MKNLLLIFALFAIVVSCDNKSGSSDKIFIDLSNSVSRSEDLSPEIKRIEFFQIANSMPIDQINNIRMMDDQLVFLHRGGRYASKVYGIVAVNKQGDILWNFDKKGKGPGEFEYISYVSFSDYSNRIIFQDARNNKLHFLDTEGNHIQSLDFKENCTLLMELPNGQFVVNSSKKRYQQASQTPSLHHDLLFLDAEAQITNQFLPNYHNGIDWFWYGETLLQGPEQLIYTNTLQYTIFTLTPEGVDSTWKLDFGEYNVDTTRYLHPKGMEDYLMETDEEGVLSIRLVHTEDNLWVLAPRMKKPLDLAVVHKKKHSITYYRKPEKRDFHYQGIPIPMFSLQQNGDCFVYSLSALEALEKWELLTAEEQASSDPKWRGMMENLDPESNPIVCMLYAK
jgi:hypothetical protein